jgi:imidazolonepropionase-like amidohydrolase
MNRRAVLAVVFAAMAFAAAAFAADPAVLIQNATILTVTQGTVRGSILLENGKIAAIGERVTAPAGATLVDGSGKYVMPGIIDCHSHIAIDGAVNEMSMSVASMVGIPDVLNPEDISIYRALAGGVTTVNVLHGSADAIGGKTVVIKTRWGKSAQEMKFEGAMPGLKFALGENPKRRGNTPAGGGPPNPADLRYPATRMGVEDVIREAFTEAKAYQAGWQEYNAKTARGEPALPPARDLKLDALVEVMEGKRLVHAHCYRQDEILMLLHVGDEFGFKIRTLQHALEAYKVAKEIADRGTGVSTFSDWWDYKMEATDAIPYNAALLTRKGVLVSLNSDDPELMRHLDKEAAKTLKYGGLSETEALSLITINPAKQLMIEQRVGSLEVGKDADVLLYDGPPLSNFSKVLKVWIDGHEYFDRDQDIAGRAAKDEEKKALVQKAADEQRRPPANETSAGRPTP